MANVLYKFESDFDHPICSLKMCVKIKEATFILFLILIWLLLEYVQ